MTPVSKNDLNASRNQNSSLTRDVAGGSKAGAMTSTIKVAAAAAPSKKAAPPSKINTNASVMSRQLTLGAKSPATGSISPSSPGRRQTQGIGGMLASMKEVEDRMEQLEALHEGVDNQVQDMTTDVERL